MPKRSTDFQRLVFLLHAVLGTDYEVTESALVKDRNGDEREIDVLLRSRVAGYDLTIGIECSEKKRPEGLCWVQAMVKKHSELKTSKLILVSRNGITASGIAAAERDGAVALRYAQIDEVSISAFALPARPPELLRVDWQIVSFSIDLANGTRGVSLKSNLGFFNADGSPTNIKELLYTELGSERAMLLMRGTPNGSKLTFNFDCSNLFVRDSEGVQLEIRRLAATILVTKTPVDLMLTAASLDNTRFLHGTGATTEGKLNVLIIPDKNKLALSLGSDLAVGEGAYYEVDEEGNPVRRIPDEEVSGDIWADVFPEK